MGKLGIDFQEGFEDDDVSVAVNDEERFHETGVRTKRVLGLATNTEIDVEDGPVSIDIRIPSRGIDKRIDLDLSRERYVGVSLENGTLKTFVRDEPFGYG